MATLRVLLFGKPRGTAVGASYVNADKNPYAGADTGIAYCDGHPGDFRNADEDSYTDSNTNAIRVDPHADHHADALDVSGPFRLRPTHPDLYAPDRKSLGPKWDQRLDQT